MASAALNAAGREYHFEDSEFTFPCASTMTTADVGKAVMIDTGVVPAAGIPPTVKLCTDNAEIFGRVEQVEVRAQEGQYFATVSLRFIGNIAMKAGETPAPGSQLVGFTGGLVKSRAALTVTDTGTTGAAVSWTMGSVKPHTVYNYDATNNVVNVAFGI